MEGPGYNGGTSSQQGTSGVTNGQPAAGTGTQTGTGTGTQTGMNAGMGAGIQPGTGTGTQTAAVQKPGNLRGGRSPIRTRRTMSFLFEKNADEKLYPASITKLMTALLVMEHGNLNDTGDVF